MVFMLKHAEGCMCARLRFALAFLDCAFCLNHTTREMPHIQACSPQFVFSGTLIKAVCVYDNVHSCSQVSVAATTLLKGSTSTDIPVSYRPLVVGDCTTPLCFTCKELGSYTYDVRLKGIPAAAERSLTFNVPLGSEESQAFRFTHWCKEKCEYNCFFKRSGTRSSTDSPFSCPATLKADPAADGGEELTLNVLFEPLLIGDSARDVLVVSSPIGGEFHCPVVGSCVQPRAQGPIDLSKGSSSVSFKNVFSSEVTFFYSIDSACFSVKPSDKVAAKKSISIPVSFRDDGSGVRNGRLTISCLDKSNAQWVFYLKA